MKRIRKFTPSHCPAELCVTLGIRRFRAEAHRLLLQIGIEPSAAPDDQLIRAWLNERTPAEFAFNFAEQLGAINLSQPATLSPKGDRRA